MTKPENPSPGVVYFDATTRRKEKMRLAAAQFSSPAVVGDSVRQTSVSDEIPPASSNSFATVSPSPPSNSRPQVNSSPNSKSQSNGIVVAASTIEQPTNHGLTTESLSLFLINFVVEHTGYPPEIVELDADLEADLGIDSIKVAQLFGELREQFSVTASDDVGLDDFPTLQHVLDYLVR